MLGGFAGGKRWAEGAMLLPSGGGRNIAGRLEFGGSEARRYGMANRIRIGPKGRRLRKEPAEIVVRAKRLTGMFEVS